MIDARLEAEPLAGARHDLIFDIGMNICEDTDFYLKKGFRVVAVEANPSSCKAAEARYPAELADGRLTILNRAISETRAPLLFYVCETQSAWSTASPKLRDHWAAQGAVFREIEVAGVRTSDVVAEYGVPHYAKIDIEGFDLVCLRGFRDGPGQPDYVSVEVDFAAVDEMLEEAKRLGYRRFALVSQSAIPGQTGPKPALEGREIDHSFARGASGLFGRELPSAWTDADEVRRQCRKIVTQYRLSGVLNRVARLPGLAGVVETVRQRNLPLACDWYDLHATF